MTSDTGDRDASPQSDEGTSPPPPPPPPSPGASASPPPGQTAWGPPPVRDAGTPTRRGLPRWAKILIVGVVVGGLVVAAGVAALVFFVLGQTRPYVDAANDYMDAVREGRLAAAAALHCDGAVPDAHRLALERSTGQNLTSVEVTGSRATVTGSLRRAAGSIGVAVILFDTPDRPCVDGIQGPFGG